MRPTTAPIEVDDEVAAPLVESGELTRYGIFSVEDLAGVDLEGSLLGKVLDEADGPVYVAPTPDVASVAGPFEVPVDKLAPRSRRSRKAAED